LLFLQLWKVKGFFFFFLSKERKEASWSAEGVGWENPGLLLCELLKFLRPGRPPWFFGKWMDLKN
jgi:hypothetical protein